MRARFGRIVASILRVQNMSHPPHSLSLETSLRTSPSAGESSPRGVFALDPAAIDLVYAKEDRERIAKLVDVREDVILTPENWRRHKDVLFDVEFIFSGWKSPVYDAEFMAATPRLKAIFYAAGSVRYCTSDAFWKRDIPICSAYAANAVPVAEYTVAVAMLGLKQFWRRAALARQGEGWGDHTRPIPGAFRATIGLVSFGMIARRVVDLLASYDLRVLVYCPYLSADEAAISGVKSVPLDELFRLSDVVSIHTPVLPETIGFIGGDLVRLMKPEATLINTARGVILDQPAVVAALRERPDLTAVLDVTNPEPPEPSDPLFALPNVIVTPHIAGSHGSECSRLGSYMVEELQRFLHDRPLCWRITQEMSHRMA
ncbi:MAG: hydroxyacid dehydrogenase [Opitutaceae bacterium]|nr:hydroxyacid dehydrogenase [Opitutaceae bacterium]